MRCTGGSVSSKCCPLSRPRPPFVLDGQHLKEAGRLAYEAAGFLRFLREFRAGTSRPIVVVGNDRYGRQWAVEPFVDMLRDDFIVRYDRVPSHMTMRLGVPSARLHERSFDGFGGWSSNAFPREFVESMGETMPHIVIADGKSAGSTTGLMRLSRGQMKYANWFVVFNDVRAEGDRSRYPGRLRHLS